MCVIGCVYVCDCVCVCMCVVVCMCERVLSLRKKGEKTHQWNVSHELSRFCVVGNQQRNES